MLVSCQARIDAKPEVVVLACRTMRSGKEREPRANEALLDEADGLELRSLCRCDLLFTLESPSLGKRRDFSQLLRSARRKQSGGPTTRPRQEHRYHQSLAQAQS